MALSIKRRRGETVKVGAATIEVYKIGPGFVTLAITAPADVIISRPDDKRPLAKYQGAADAK